MNLLGLTIVGVILGGVLLGMGCGYIKCPKKRMGSLLIGITSYIALSYIIIMSVVNGSN